MQPTASTADNIDDKQQEPPTADQPASANDEWLRYQQHVAERLAGGSLPNPRRVPPRPLDEAELTALHAANPPADPEPLIVDYIAPTPVVIPPPAPIIATPLLPPAQDAAPPAPDPLLPWAKRLTFALFGGFIGTYAFATGVNWWGLSDVLPALFHSAVAPIAAALALTFLMRKTSNYAKWGAIAVTMTTMLPLIMLFAAQSRDSVATFLQDPYLNNPNVSASDVNWLLTDIANETNKGFFYLAEGIGVGLLAMFAVWKSLRGGWKIPGLLLVLAALGTSALLFYGEQAIAGNSLLALGNILVYLTPIVMIILYLFAAGQDRDNHR